MKINQKSKCSQVRIDNRDSTRFSAASASRQKGQALLELALLLPFLLLLMIGIIEVGRLAYYSIEVSGAARAGAQYATQSLAFAAAAAATPDETNITSAASNEAPDIGAGLTVTALQACGCPGSAAGACPAAGCTYPLVYLTVRTTFTVAPLFHYPGFPGSFPLTGVATLPVRQ